MVPYFDSTDHHAFNPAPIGVPGTSLTNWPDEYIHGTGDDLENIDATQLERNAVVVAGVALYFAGLGEDGAAPLAAYVAARARSRAAADVATAVAHLQETPAARRDAAYRMGRALIQHSYRKELQALATVRRFAPAPRGRVVDYLAQANKVLEDAMEADMTDLERAHAAITGSRNPPNLEMSKDDKAMAQKVYVPVADYGAWKDALDKTQPVRGLHSMMRFEVYNFADGRRTAWEVYEAVASEALSAGAWYYGQVSAADVLEALERGAKAGAYTVRNAK
jgi:hypothetical protein